MHGLRPNPVHNGSQRPHLPVHNPAVLGYASSPNMRPLTSLPTLRFTPLLIAATILLGAQACGGGHKVRGPRGPITAHRLYPMQNENVWSYDVDTGQDTSTLAITRVLDVTNGQVQITSGSDPVFYEIKADGIWKFDQLTWLIKNPIEVGNEWAAPKGATARIAATDERVETVAGKFSRCVRIEERGGSEQRHVDTTYCPDVGPVLIYTQVQLGMVERTVEVKGELRGYSIEGHTSIPH